MKKNILLFILLSYCLAGYSQFTIKAGLTGNFAFDKMAKNFVGGPGVDINAKYVIAGRIGIGVSTGFQHFFAKDWGDGYDDIGLDVVPLRLSVNYYFGEIVKPYIGCELGVNFTDLKYTYNYYDVYGDYYSLLHYDYPNKRFGAAVLVGLQVGMGNLLALDLNVKVNQLAEVGSDAPKESASYVGLNIGLLFKF